MRRTVTTLLVCLMLATAASVLTQTATVLYKEQIDTLSELDSVVTDASFPTKYWGGAVLESPADADAFLQFKAPYALTITDIECIVDPADTGESVVIDLRECNGTGDSCVTVDATITCDNDGAADDGTLTNGSIDSGDWVLLDIGTVTGTVTGLTVTYSYTVD